MASDPSLFRVINGYTIQRNQPLTVVTQLSTTNIILQSQAFSTAVWSKSSTSVTDNVAIAPDGTMTAASLVPNAASGTYKTIQQATITANTTYTISLHAKANTYNFLHVIVDNNIGRATWSLVDGSSHAWAGSFVIATSQQLPNGWWRISFSISPVGSQNLWIGADSTSHDPGNPYTNDGVSGAYIWGVQVEAGTTASPYVKTTTNAASANYTITSTTTINPGDPRFWWWSITNPAPLSLPFDLQGFWPDVTDLEVALRLGKKYK